MSRAISGVTATQKPFSVFISYSHKDEAYRRALETHLSFLRRAGQLTVWHDRMIGPGEEWERRITDALELADIILLLISPDFADSDYCWGIETTRALERREQNDAIVIPILIRPVAGWTGTPIGKLQALPLDARPVALWSNPDEAYQNIAEGLQRLIANIPQSPRETGPEWTKWVLTLDGTPADYPPARQAWLAAALRKAANSEKLRIEDVLPGSARLCVNSAPAVLDALTRLHAEGELAQRLGVTILGIGPDPGAILRVESRIVDGEFRSSIRYLPELFGGRALEEGFPPLVGGVEFPLDDPLKIGFSLLADATHEMPSAAEQVELQTRLGRYLNTFLVLKGEHVNVNLSPLESYCGLPELLRNTELGRDLLAQDVVLKHFTAAQMHPSTPHGKAFWDRANAIPDAGSRFESCFRVWIVPGKVAVRESMKERKGCVAIEKLGLDVLCEQDYETMRRFREARQMAPAPDRSPQLDAGLISLFQELILPEIQKEVSLGPRFGLLRQILSVLVVAKWIMQSQLGEALTRAGFIGSDSPRKYGLTTVEDAVLDSMKQTYLELFGSGVWQHSTLRVHPETGMAERRLYIAGGIAGPSSVHSASFCCNSSLLGR